MINLSICIVISNSVYIVFSFSIIINYYYVYVCENKLKQKKKENILIECMLCNFERKKERKLKACIIILYF